MFWGNFSVKDEVRLEDTPADLFKHFLKWCYTGKVSVFFYQLIATTLSPGTDVMIFKNSFEKIFAKIMVFLTQKQS
jgi:hypothetical protein